MISIPILVSVISIFHSGNGQKLIQLSEFKGNSASQLNATGPFSLYVSASSDSNDLLSKVFVKTLDGSTTSLYQLKANKMHTSSGFLQPFRVNAKKASLVSNLTDSQMKSLRGFLYVTTTRQMNNNAFFVFDVDQTQTISFDETKPDNCTIVFLNSNFSSNPAQSSTISEWVQSENASVWIYPGVPGRAEEKPFSFIFSNPVHTTEKDRFVDSVEKFSLSLPSFYIKTHKGIQFSISPSYYDVNGSQQGSLTATGLYMKPFDVTDRNVTLHMLTINTFVKDTSRKLTGANAIGSMPQGSSVEVYSRNADGNGNGYGVTPVDQMLGWSTPDIGNIITISSEKATKGQFFVQWYTLYSY